MALIVFSYFFLDRPMASFIHGHFYDKSLLVFPTHIVYPLTVLAAIVLLTLAVKVILGRKFGPLEAVALRCSLSLVVAAIFKDQLKVLFGRTWPETWIENNPSYFGSGAYGFHPMHGGIGFSSFPSGHMTEICAVMAVLWFYFPRFRWLYVLLSLSVAIGLLGADYHWLSDIIAGTYLGAAVGLIAVRVGRDMPSVHQGPPN